LLEAMAADLAVVATAVGGNVDAVIDNETGLLVDAGDPRALAAAMLRLAKSPQLRRRLAEAARARLERQFTLEACVDRYEKLYRAVSEPNPAPVSEILADTPRESARRDTVAAPIHAT